MSRQATAINPGRTNRRFIMLAFVLGLIGAVLIYVAFSRGESTGPATIPGTPVVVAKENIPARTTITQSMLEVRLVPEDVKSELSYTDAAAVVGQRTRFQISANEQVLPSKLVPLGSAMGATNRSLSLIVPQGQRGFAISVSQVVNAGGLVLPGDYVDVIVVYDIEFQSSADPTDRETADSYFVHTLFQNVEVLAVEQGIVDIVPEATPTTGRQRVRNTEEPANPEAATVTLALTPDQVQTVYLAESNGRIRLSVRPFGESDEPAIDYQIEPDLFPANLENPFLR